MSEVIKIPPLYSVADINKMSFKILEFEGEWRDLIGKPEIAGCWLIWGLSGNGKTRFALKLAKYLCTFQRVYYNTLEEGLKVSFKKALNDNNMHAVGNKFGYHKENLQQMRARLSQKRSPNIVIIDSLQYLNPTKEEVKALLDDFPKKLFIFISQANGSQPKGEVADDLKYHSDVKIRVDKFLAIPTESTRYGGFKPFVIWEEGYRKANVKIT
ncbi:TPA: ATP-binding protein [Elizabethkingia anophelis]|nr:ATP-binding protein [Elizabethkingia anophelis]HAT4009592.1 ATP-binding protein [Elizabethkingia anophelis]